MWEGLVLVGGQVLFRVVTTPEVGGRERNVIRNHADLAIIDRKIRN